MSRLPAANANLAMRQRTRGSRAAAMGVALLASADWLLAQTNTAVSTAPSLPDVNFSVLRVLGALALVLALFLAGVWCVRRLPLLAKATGRAPQLRVIEARGLGGRHTLYVVGHREQRFLIASSPAGVTMLSRLPDEAAVDTGVGAGSTPSFGETLQQALRKP